MCEQNIAWYIQTLSHWPTVTNNVITKVNTVNTKCNTVIIGTSALLVCLWMLATKYLLIIDNKILRLLRPRAVAVM